MPSFSSVIAWLSKRFPEQLTVSKQDYTELRQEVAGYNVLYQNVNQVVDKITSFEKRLQKLEEAQGFVQQGKTSFKLER